MRQDPVYAAIFVASTVTYAVSMIVGNTFIAKRRAGFYLAHSLILGVLRLPLLIILAIFFRSFGIFVSWGLSWLVALTVSISLFLPTG